MSIRNRPTQGDEPRWYTRVYDPARDRLVERKAGRTAKAARALERRWQDQVDEHGTIVDLAGELDDVARTPLGAGLAKNPLFREWARVYVDTFASGLKSKAHVERQVAALVEFFGELRLSAITPLRVAAFRKWCLEEGNRLRRGSGTSERTLRIRLELLRTIWNRAYDENLVVSPDPMRPPKNPVQRRDLPAIARREVKLPTEVLWQALLEACRPRRASRETPRLEDLVLFLRYTGCRVGEALNLGVLDVDTRARELTFRATKNGDDRTLPLLDHVREILERQTIVDGKYFAGEAQRNRMRLAWERARARVGMEHVHLHDLRHFASTWMTAQGVDYVSNEYVLGHRVRGVFGLYTHATREGVANALAALRNPFPDESASATYLRQDDVFASLAETG